jgi:hypothetical protein
MIRKIGEIGRFTLHNRKISAYIPKIELSPTSNRKISAYFTSANDDKISYLKIKTFKPRFLLMTRLPYLGFTCPIFVTNVI